MLSHPFTDYGHDINELWNSVRGKANSYEINALVGDVGSLERAIGEIRSVCDGLRAELQAAQSRIEMLEGKGDEHESR